MMNNFVLVPVDDIRLEKGLPEALLMHGPPPNERYPYPLFSGAQAYHLTGNFGTLIFQEVSTAYASLRHNFFQWLKEEPQKIQHNICGIYARALLKGKWKETIVGAGNVPLKEGEFYTLISKAWKSKLLHQVGDYSTTIETNWSPSFLEAHQPASHKWKELMKQSFPMFPKIIGGPYRFVTAEMTEVFYSIFNCGYDEPIRGTFLEEQFDYLFQLTMQQVEGSQWMKTILSKSDRDCVERTKEIIAADLDIHYTIEQLAQKAGVNDQRLKAIFRRATGKGMSEYRVYHLCLRARDEILTSKLPVKHFFRRAGYKSLSAFVTGFKRQLGCNPGELRR